MMVRRRFVAVALGVLAATASLMFAVAPDEVHANASAIAVGQPAPAFRLQNQNGEWVTLEQQRGKWLVLYFYPKDNTPGCTTQACEFRDNIFAYRKAGAVILGVSVDDLASHRKFAEEHSLPFPILADADKKTAQSYGVLYKAMGIMEVARRETFIIDPAGRIARHFKSVNPKGHSELVLAEIKALQAAGRRDP